MSPMFEEVKKLTVAETIVNQVKERILEGQLIPGQKLPSERELAEQLSVGRSSVREATSAMVALGIVAIRPGEGVFIRTDFPRSTIASIEWSSLMLTGSAQDLVEARISVETATAKLAALRATAEQRRYLHRLAEQMDSTAKLEDFVGLDIAFHMTLAQASQNYVLGEIIRGIQQLMRSFPCSRVLATQ